MGTTRVSEAKRKLILKRARELKDKPSHAAMALKSGLTGVVAIFHHGLGVEGSEIDREFTVSACKCLHKHDLHLWPEYFEKPEALLKACRDEVIRNVETLTNAGMPVADDSPIAREYARVPLTSSITETETFARLSVEALVKAVNGEPSESRGIEPELRIRASTDPAAE